MRFGNVVAAARALERYFLPAACLLCDQPAPTDDDALVCPVCRSRWRAIPGPWCDRCGQPLTPDVACRICEAWPAALARVRSAVWLDEGARAAVHRLKYEGWWRVAEPISRPMRTLEPVAAGRYLIPIPLSRRRQRERGYNQSEHLVRALAEATGLPVATDVLRRVRETSTQTALAPEERRANIAGAFQCDGLRPGVPLLVDDVFTTGATLAAAATALAGAGAACVEAITFARARPPVA